MNLYKIKFHPLFLIVTLIMSLTGHFKEILILTSIIVVHELGHVIMSTIFKWKIEKIVILPMGGMTIFNNDINTPLIEELLVAISGPLLQFFVFLNFHNNLVLSANYFILLFNLLPIYPLDGSKILNIIFNVTTSFKTSMLATIIISTLSIIILLLIEHSLLSIITIFFLIRENIKLFSNINYVFNKFLLERHLKNYHFKKVKTIKKISNMKRDYIHIFKYQNKLILESKILTKMFDFK